MLKYNLVRLNATRAKTVVAKNVGYNEVTTMKKKFDRTSKLNKCEYHVRQISPGQLKKMKKIMFAMGGV